MTIASPQYSDEEREDIQVTCGKAFGFAIAAAAEHQLQTEKGLIALANRLEELIDGDSLSFGVGHTMMGIVEGLRAAARNQLEGRGEVV